MQTYFSKFRPQKYNRKEGRTSFRWRFLSLRIDGRNVHPSIYKVAALFLFIRLSSSINALIIESRTSGERNARQASNRNVNIKQKPRFYAWLLFWFAHTTRMPVHAGRCSLHSIAKFPVCESARLGWDGSTLEVPLPEQAAKAAGTAPITQRFSDPLTVNRDKQRPVGSEQRQHSEAEAKERNTDDHELTRHFARGVNSLFNLLKVGWPPRQIMRLR